MDNRVKETLKVLLKQHGGHLGYDIDRLKGLLYDACPDRKREIGIILAPV